jgi:hypothetical protein
MLSQGTNGMKGVKTPSVISKKACQYQKHQDKTQIFCISILKSNEIIHRDCQAKAKQLLKVKKSDSFSSSCIE